MSDDDVSPTAEQAVISAEPMTCDELDGMSGRRCVAVEGGSLVMY